MSQSDLATAAGVTNSATSDYERGKVDPQSHTLSKILRGLDLPVRSRSDQTFVQTVAAR